MAVSEDAVSLFPVVLTEDDIPGAKLVEPLETHTIRELSWWIECRGHRPPPTSASKTVYCREVRKIMAANLPVIDIDGSHTERKRKMMQETGVHVEPFVETSTPPFPPLGWISDRGEVARRIPHLPRDTLYDYLSGKSVQPGAETFRALKKGYVFWMSGRVQSIQINDRHPHLLFVKSKIAPSMKEGTYTVQLWMKKRDASINHAMCQCPAG